MACFLRIQRRSNRFHQRIPVRLSILRLNQTLRRLPYARIIEQTGDGIKSGKGGIDQTSDSFHTKCQFLPLRLIQRRNRALHGLRKILRIHRTMLYRKGEQSCRGNRFLQR